MANSPSVQVKVGAVQTSVSQIGLTVIDGAPHPLLDKINVSVNITPKDGRRAGESILLTLSEYAALKELFASADAQLEQIQRTDGPAVCPNCKVPPRGAAGADCAFCGYVYPQAK